MTSSESEQQNQRALDAYDPTIAVAVFVKTPGRSPVKTRLANELGHNAAAELYLKCCDALRSVFHACQEQGLPLQPYWAIAESESRDNANNHWSDFPRLWQGDGLLGDRLARVYASLLERHRGAILLGADCPQISMEQIAQSVKALQSRDSFVCGPARDGGFYLFGGTQNVPAGVWQSVRYSSEHACTDLISEIESIGSVTHLEPLSDIDFQADIAAVLREFERECRFTPDQMTLRDWLMRPSWPFAHLPRQVAPQLDGSRTQL